MITVLNLSEFFWRSAENTDLGLSSYSYHLFRLKTILLQLRKCININCKDTVIRLLAIFIWKSFIVFQLFFKASSNIFQKPPKTCPAHYSCSNTYTVFRIDLSIFFEKLGVQIQKHQCQQLWHPWKPETDENQKESSGILLLDFS